MFSQFEHVRRFKQQVIDWNDEIEIDKEDINKMVTLINKKSEETIKKCNELIKLEKKNWKK